MAHGEFVWCDLSSKGQRRDMAFYAALFGWQWDPDEPSEMNTAIKDGVPVAGLFEMADKFQSIGLPAFWMSYIEVSDVDAAAALAGELGGKVEVGPTDVPGGGRIALIRDPLGAGFTVVQGLPAAALSAAPGHRLGHGLFVSDQAAIAPFYSALFGWEFGQPDNGVQSVRLGDRHLFHCHEIPDPNLRGKEEYWAVLFAVAGNAQQAGEIGGSTIAQVTLPEGAAELVRDPSGAALFLLRGDASMASSPGAAPALPWRGWLGLSLVLISALSSHLWPWVIFLGLWVIQGLRDGQTHLLEPVTKTRHPVLYWTVMAVFLALAVICALFPFGVS